MAGVVAVINKSSMAKKLKATDAVAGSMLAVAKLGLAAMQQTKNAPSLSARGSIGWRWPEGVGWACLA
jgi:hypothetical protein